MKRRIIKFVLAIILISAGALQICSCNARKEDNGVNGGNGIGAEASSLNGEDGAEVEYTDSPDSQVSMQDIANAKQSLIQALNDNYDIFNDIVSYFENDPEQYYCIKENGEIVMKLRTDGPSLTDIYVDINEIEVCEQIIYVINELGFLGVAAYDYAVDFWIIDGGRYPFGGSYAQGIICNKSDAGDGKISEWEGSIFGENIHIRDEWYYQFRHANY